MMLIFWFTIARKVCETILRVSSGCQSDPHCSKTFLARLCEQAERYDEMVTYMKEVASVRYTGETHQRCDNL